jgi:hypothetical protein
MKRRVSSSVTFICLSFIRVIVFLQRLVDFRKDVRDPGTRSQGIPRIVE